MAHTSRGGADEQNNIKQPARPAARTPFEFISYSSKNNKSKIRRHLALQQHRKRRWQEYGEKYVFGADIPGPNLTDGTDQSQSHMTRLDIKVWCPPSISKNKAKPSYKSSKGSTIKRVSKLENVRLRENLARSTFNVTQTTSSRNILGEGRLDPFQVYPIKATSEVHLLVDHCNSHNDNK